jgi:outer membrane protein assembly factor BamE (lipoprotein component of BamABCDE complex)
MRKLKRLTAVCATWMLSACMSIGTKVEPGQLAQFRQGVTTEAQIVNTLGEPNQRSTLADGRSSIAYLRLEGRPNAALFIPVVGPFVGTAESESTAVRFVFDINGRLAETTTETSTMRGGVFGN